MKKISYFLSHPIQYQSPLLREFSERDFCDFEVAYFHNNVGKQDSQFGKEIIWDIPLLEGYKHVFLKNHSKSPGVSGKFWGLINWGILGYLIKRRPDAIVVHGWGYFSNLLLILLAKILTIEILMRSESPLKQEKGKSRLNNLLKRTIILLSDKFMYIGTENKKFYKYFGAKEEQLYFTPYCVDNKRLQKQSDSFDVEKENIRLFFNIPKEHRVILFCGKFIEKKRPLDLLKAIDLIDEKNFSIIFVGTGILEEEMKTFVTNKNLKNIHFAGFVNQTELYKFYASSDIFVLPSGYGETWGLVVNEAMNFSLPIIVSRTVGCTDDLVKEGVNGYTYAHGDINELSNCLTSLLALDKKEIENMGKASLEIVKTYSFDNVIEGLKQAIK